MDPCIRWVDDAFSSWGKRGERQGKGENVTGDDPHASDALLAFDAILHYASRGRLDDAPVRVDAG